MASQLKPARPLKREGFWYLVRRVPDEFTSYDQRKQVTLSTGIRVPDDPKAVVASKVVADLDGQLCRFWQDKKNGRNVGSEQQYQKAVVKAAALGVRYLPQQQIAELNLGDLLARVSTFLNGRVADDLVRVGRSIQITEDAQAVLGGVQIQPAPEKSGLLLSEMFDAYQVVKAGVLAKKSLGQLKRWKVAQQSALDGFLKAIGGDREMSKLSRADVLGYRQAWQDRALKGEVRISSANRWMRKVAAMFRAVNKFHQMELKDVFEGQKIEGGEDGKRISYDIEFVRDEFLAEGRFAALNPEARRITYLTIETGLRLSEACNLTKHDIVLNHPIPHLKIRGSEEASGGFRRDVKTKSSVRNIPLVGVALKVMMLHPGGFPRYRDKADVVSALVNKTLVNLKMRPGGRLQSLYSLRHTFMDRLIAVDCPSAVREDLMGHVHMYGHGTELAHMLKWLQLIAFPAPDDI